MRYRILLISLVAAIAAYVIYWLVLSGQVRGTIADWIEARKAEGIEVTYDKMSISGFPYRFEVEMVKPVIAKAGGNRPFRWTSPRLVMDSLAWKPGHVVVFTEDSTLDVDNTPFGRASVGIAGGKASFVTAVGGEMKRIAAVADALTIKLSAKPGQISTVGHAEAHLRTESDFPEPKEGDVGPNAPPLDDVAISMADVHLAGIPHNPYGNVISLLEAQVELRGITPPARAAKQMAAWRDRGGSVELTRFVLKWGIYDAKATGTLALDKEMRPLGAFVVRVKGYEPLIDYLHAINLIDLEMATDAKATLNMIVQSGTAEDEGRVSVPIALQGGRFFFGPLPLARLPSIAPLLTTEEAAPVVPAVPAAAPPAKAPPKAAKR